MKALKFAVPALALALACAQSAVAAGAPVTIAAQEDVMTSPFFQGANQVRGYGIETTRPVLRVSSNNPMGLTGAEVIYLTFDQAAFSGFTGSVQATLTLQSTSGSFGADASEDSPFLVSAHGVTANPLTTISDDTNPAGTVSAAGFLQNHVLAADAAARTSVAGFGAVTFDVSSIVNSWINGSNTVYAIALTGLNDTSGVDFLHGFENNNNAGVVLGSTFLSVSAVPEPQSMALLLAGAGIVGAVAVRRRRAA